MDVLAVEEATRKAAAEARGGGRPCFLGAADLPLPRPFDVRPDLYRTKEEIERWKQHDPIRR